MSLALVRVRAPLRAAVRHRSPPASAGQWQEGTRPQLAMDDSKSNSSAHRSPAAAAAGPPRRRRRRFALWRRLSSFAAIEREKGGGERARRSSFATSSRRQNHRRPIRQASLPGDPADHNAPPPPRTAGCSSSIPDKHPNKPNLLCKLGPQRWRVPVSSCGGRGAILRGSRGRDHTRCLLVRLVRLAFCSLSPYSQTTHRARAHTHHHHHHPHTLPSIFCGPAPGGFAATHSVRQFAPRHTIAGFSSIGIVIRLYKGLSVSVSVSVSEGLLKTFFVWVCAPRGQANLTTSMRTPDT